MGWSQCYGGAGGSTAPTFSETVLYDNPSGARTFTISQDFHGFDLVRFELHNESTGTNTCITTTPNSIDAIYSKTSVMCLNELNNNQYLTLTWDLSTLTFTYNNYRNLVVTKVVGLNCTNMTMTETEIYKASAYSSTSVVVDSQTSLYDYDYLLVVANGGWDEIQPCYYPIIKEDKADLLSGFYMFIPRIINPYNSYQSIQFNSEYQLSSARYFYVVGIKFT